MSHTLKVWNSCRKKFELNVQTDIWYLEDENCRKNVQNNANIA
jgi:hypothetical protein